MRLSIYSEFARWKIFGFQPFCNEQKDNKPVPKQEIPAQTCSNSVFWLAQNSVPAQLTNHRNISTLAELRIWNCLGFVELPLKLPSEQPISFLKFCQVHDYLRYFGLDHQTQMMLKIFTNITNNERAPLMYDPAEAKFVPSEHHTFGKKMLTCKKTLTLLVGILKICSKRMLHQGLKV